MLLKRRQISSDYVEWKIGVSSFDLLVVEIELRTIFNGTNLSSQNYSDYSYS